MSSEDLPSQWQGREDVGCARLYGMTGRIFYNKSRKDEEKMNTMNKIRLLKNRLYLLTTRDRDNYGVRRKVQREIRRLKKENDWES